MKIIWLLLCLFSFPFQLTPWRLICNGEGLPHAMKSGPHFEALRNGRLLIATDMREGLQRVIGRGSFR